MLEHQPTIYDQAEALQAFRPDLKRVGALYALRNMELMDVMVEGLVEKGVMQAEGYLEESDG